MAGEGGELVRKRSFSRKSMLVPDRVPAGRRRSSAIVPRRARPNLQAKIVAGKKAIQLQKKQKQMEGQKKQEVSLRESSYFLSFDQSFLGILLYFFLLLAFPLVEARRL